MLPSTILMHYNYEFSSISNILEKLLDITSKCQIRNLGLHIQSQSTNVLSLSGAERSNVNRTSLRENSSVRQFFRTLVQERFPKEGGHIDFFLINPVQDQVGIGQTIQYGNNKQISVRFIQRFLYDNPSQSNRRIIEIYFDFDKLMRTKQEEQMKADRTRLPTQTSGYERIRVVGKGSFGSAILYRRKDDDSLVILKEINMHDLTSNERQLALNEVALLSRMDHPHIISYYDSFEEDGILMIEMEYAEGGTLAQFLARREEYIEETDIMFMFEQMLSAVSYLHDNNVLHRDLKTANIFLTKDNLVKIGDFGISKIMGTETRFQGAQTVVGTPYYISPEMCEGKPYNEKSDIWALGCILYEMACLQKTFEGTSLPALVNKIVKVDPEQRPTAALALEIVQRSRSLNTKRGQKKSVHRPGSDTLRPRDCHSALYQFDIANVTLSSIAALAPKIKVKQIAVGWNHQVLLTMDSVVYSWGDNKFGQLGHGDRRTRNQPTRVEALDGKSIFHISVGTNFSAFCADRGIVMVCGNRKYTGNGKANDDWLKPKLIDCLLREDIIDLSCGYEHAAVVTDDGQVYVWGNGENGRLGTGKTDFVYSATKVHGVFCTTHQRQVEYLSEF
uniref:non-specific serine/threonine protein kinase n=1 Tax=Acrobeloides nanus TaxID=290746 RepID=A0A914DTP9_9BILA